MPDNGLFTMVVEQQGFQAAYTLTEPAYFRDPQVSATFHGRDIFAPVAAHLSLGVDPAQFGPRLTDVVTFDLARPYWSKHTLIGAVRHVDHFGNVITNITRHELARDDLQDIQFGQRLVCRLGTMAHSVPFVRTYAEAAPGELVCLINSEALFELAINQGHAADRIEAEIGAPVHVSLGV